ncbi:lysozyme g isoform X1 [Oryzias melastigma]|uniref:Lysozyme g n=1 Tax=Oryzias melastigma TaxID=30732 RepID=A0A3B3DE63_ORYME|nr:lysozyme g isoform X1 [Oryzias melastigma]
MCDLWKNLFAFGQPFQNLQNGPVLQTYGDIMKVQTSGASEKTAKQDNLPFTGVRASHRMAQTDEGRMRNYKDIIMQVGSEFHVDPAIIAGIISRESRAGNALDDGWGDWNPERNAYNAFGLMQVDVNPKGGNHDPQGKWNDVHHLRQGTGILVHFINQISQKPAFQSCTKEQKLKGGIAAYNMGDGNVHSYDKVDENTTGGDYSNDVTARAHWYKQHFFN